MPSGARRRGGDPRRSILGGFLVDAAGWPWVFFVNVPVGIITFVLASRLVPRVDTHAHAFGDWLGVALSAVGMFLLVFRHPGGPPARLECRDLSMIVVRASRARLFIAWQARNRRGPLVPSVSSATATASPTWAISTMGFAITAMAIPLMIWAQVVRGLSPTRAAADGADGAREPASRPDRGSAHRSGPPAAADGPRLHRHGLARGDSPDHLADDRPVVDGRPHAAARHREQLRLGPGTAPPRPRNLPPRHAGAGSGSATPPARSAQCSARPPSPSSWTRLAAQGLKAAIWFHAVRQRAPVALAVAENSAWSWRNRSTCRLQSSSSACWPLLFFERPGHLARR